MEEAAKLQWHPAFCAAVELELREDKDILEYEREYNLGKLPPRVDLLVIKKKPGAVLKNEIGDFFLGSNLMEYKSPDDEVNIDTFYKVLAYACLYKAEAGRVDEIRDTDITISLIREGKPVKLLSQLAERYQVTEKYPGIYRVGQMLFPMQIIATGELEPGNHVWLKALTRSLGYEDAGNLILTYQGLDGDDRKNAGAVVNLTTDANEAVFLQIVKEGGNMSDAIMAFIEPKMAEMELIISNQNIQLEAKDAEIEAKDARLEAKDVEIENQKVEIEAKDAEIEAKDARLEAKDLEIENQKAEIEILRKQLREAEKNNAKK